MPRACLAQCASGGYGRGLKSCWERLGFWGVGVFGLGFRVNRGLGFRALKP